VQLASLFSHVGSAEPHDGRPTLELALSSSLNGLLDLIVGSTLLDAASQVNNGDVLGGNTQRHAGKLAVKLRDDLADSLGSAGAARDDVGSSGTATSPVLGGGAIYCLLGSSVGVNSGHETLDDGILVVDDLGERSQAVGGARSIGDNIGLAIVGLLVYAHDVHRGISRRGRDDDLLSTTDQVSLGLLGGGEDTGGLDDIFSTSFLPGDSGGVALCVEFDLVAVDNEVVALNGDGTVEETVGGVVLEHVLGILGLNERVVDSNDLDFRVLDSVAEDDTANAAETVDTDLSNHVDIGLDGNCF